MGTWFRSPLQATGYPLSLPRCRGHVLPFSELGFPNGDRQARLCFSLPAWMANHPLMEGFRACAEAVYQRDLESAA